MAVGWHFHKLRVRFPISGFLLQQRLMQETVVHQETSLYNRLHIFTNNFKETNLKSLFYIYRNWCLVSNMSKGNSYDRNRENLLILDEYM